MKKTILTLIVALFAVTAFAQNEENAVRVPGGYQGFFEYGNNWHLDKNVPTCINLSTTHGFYFNGHIYVGVGFGVEFNKEYALVPFYGNLRYVFNNRTSVSPLLSLRLGSYISSNMGAYADLGFGVRFASKRDFAVTLMVIGTYYDKLTYEACEEYEDENGIWVNDYVQKTINPSSVGLRIGLEW